MLPQVPGTRVLADPLVIFLRACSEVGTSGHITGFMDRVVGDAQAVLIRPGVRGSQPKWLFKAELGSGCWAEGCSTVSSPLSLHFLTWKVGGVTLVSPPQSDSEDPAR